MRQRQSQLLNADFANNLGLVNNKESLLLIKSNCLIHSLSNASMLSLRNLVLAAIDAGLRAV